MELSVSKVRNIGWCKQYGPGRLPGAERPARGAGYAFATAALAAALLFQVVLIGLGLNAESGPLIVSFWDALGMGSGLFAVPLVVPSAFVVAMVVRELLQIRGALYGVIDGLLVTVGTYLMAGVVLGLQGVLIWALSAGETSLSFWLGGAVFVTVAGFVFTFWLTLPLGALSGYIHYRARTQHA